MARSARPLAFLLSAALIAGCGGASSAESTPAPEDAAVERAAPAAGGQLEVGITDGGIGTAVRGGRRGLETLPNGPVEGRSNTEQGVGAGARCQNADLAPSRSNVPAIVASTLCLLNGERRDAGIAPLSQNAKLASAAVAHSRDMVDKRYFDHVARNGSSPTTRIRRTGYIPSAGAWTVGENLAWGTGSLASPKQIVKAWMKSQGHRENILRGRFKEIGFGVVIGNPRSRDGATYTTTFGGVTGSRAGRNRASRRARTAQARTAKARTRKAKARTRKARATWQLVK